MPAPLRREARQEANMPGEAIDRGRQAEALIVDWFLTQAAWLWRMQAR
jgi:hypothetical protein